MEIEEAIEVMLNEMPHCGKKITYTEEEKTEAYNMAIRALNTISFLDMNKDVKVVEDCMNFITEAYEYAGDE